MTVRCAGWEGPSQLAHRTVTYRQHYTRWCTNTIRPPDDEQRVARNMYRIIIINVLHNAIVHQVGHLPTEHSVRYAAIIASGGAHIFQKSSGHPKYLGTATVTWGEFHTEDPQILGPTSQNLVAGTRGGGATWRQRFVHPWLVCSFL